MPLYKIEKPKDPLKEMTNGELRQLIRSYQARANEQDEIIDKLREEIADTQKEGKHDRDCEG